MLEILNDSSVKEDYVLSRINRYNHRTRNHDESVASHSFYVGLFCLKIMEQVPLNMYQQNKVLILALLHDTPESMTSDIPHDLKVKYPQIKDILWDIEDDYYKTRWSFYQSVIDESDELVTSIIKLADAYSVHQFCLDEFDSGNSSAEMKEVNEEAYERIIRITKKINEIIAGGSKNAKE